MSSADGAVPAPRYELGELGAAVRRRLEAWAGRRAGERLWQRDHRLWSERPLAEIEDRLGWLDLPRAMPALLDELEPFAAEAAAEGLTTVVLVGMGGSSLGAEMLQVALGDPRRLRVADSTHPDAVLDLAAELDPAGTVFVVSSKSGTTVETDSLMRFFWRWLEDRVERPADHFVAVTDPGSSLARTAAERGFRRLFEAPPDVGGRYSVLGPFGLVPAALGGLRLRELGESAAAMAAACGPDVAVTRNPGLILAAFLGEAALVGRSTLRLAGSGPAAGFAPWLEQLVAESTGKDGLGILPVAAHPRRAAGPASGAVLVETGPAGGDAPPPSAWLPVAAGSDLGGEVFRWQMATAMASAIIGVHPFDQPDVQLAKKLAQRAVRGEADAAPPPCVPLAEADLAGWLEGARGYCAVQAFLAPDGAADEALEKLRRAVGGRAGVAATLGHGPRFLHSTGQLHKGGPAGGSFVQLVDRPRDDAGIPGTDLSFGRLLRAQADGDAAALVQRGRRLLRIDLGGDAGKGLEQLLAGLEPA